jgi:hypothetical protein
MNGEYENSWNVAVAFFGCCFDSRLEGLRKLMKYQSGKSISSTARVGTTVTRVTLYLRSEVLMVDTSVLGNILSPP